MKNRFLNFYSHSQICSWMYVSMKQRYHKTTQNNKIATQLNTRLGRYYWSSHFFGPGSLHAPPVVADESKAGHCFHLLFGPSVLACATRGGGQSEAGHCFHQLFFLFLLLLFFFFSAFYFSPTSGNLPCVKICFPQYFGINRRYMQKKNIFFR